MESLSRRFEAQTTRFLSFAQGRSQVTALQQAPPPRFGPVSYGGAAETLLLGMGEESFVPLRLAGKLSTAIKEKAARQLISAFPGLTSEIEWVLCGRPKDANFDHKERVRVIPLPSIGHRHVDMSVRRVWVEIPNGPIVAEDLKWAFSGQEIEDTPGLGKLKLIPLDDLGMTRHYGRGQASSVWQTVTPVVVPEVASRRRISPGRQREEAKGGLERAKEEAAASFAVRQALRHSGVDATVRRIEVQREPFHLHGERAERFERETRFPKERLWHVRLEFAEKIEGPLLIGDGRWTGLGLFAPVPPTARFLRRYRITDGLLPGGEKEETVCGYFRKSVMSLLGGAERKKLEAVFSGHSDDGNPLEHQHLYFGADLYQARRREPFLFVFAPALDAEQRHSLLSALDKLKEIRAGAAGLLKVKRGAGDSDNKIFGSSRHWVSHNDYSPTRHPKGSDPTEELEADIRLELSRHRYPEPSSVRVLRIREGPRGGIKVRFALNFARPVAGPILLGRNAHFGGGLMRVRT
jgi:CRISPR-associated protein Csb2